MRAIPQYKNPRFQLRAVPVQPITLEEYRRIRKQQLGFIAKLMRDLMSITYGQPKRISDFTVTNNTYAFQRDQIAGRQKGLAHIRRQLAEARRQGLVE